MGTIKPKFIHDCTVCTFLGQDTTRNYDLYYCIRGSTGSIIARYGNAGPEYTSAPLPVAVQLAKLSEKEARLFQEALSKCRSFIKDSVLDQ